MSDTTTVKSGEETKPAIDTSKYVPKDTVTQLQADLDKAKMDLLSPDYLEFLATKGAASKTPADTKAVSLIGELTPQEIETLPKAKLLQLAEQRIGAKVTKEVEEKFNKQLGSISAYVSSLGAWIELQDIRKKYPDFDENQEDIQKILDAAKTEVTYEQAYLQAKGAKSTKSDKSADTKDKDTAPKAKGNEKPGAVAPEGGTTKTFKTDQDAGMDAWEQVKTRHNLTGDTL